MPETERPKSRLPNGKINPAYTAWRKIAKVKESCVALVSAPGAVDEYKRQLNESARAESPSIHSRPTPPEIAVAADSVTVAGKAFPKNLPTQIITLKCIKSAKNPKFVFCDLGGVKVPVRCKRGLSKKMPGKRIKVSVDNSGPSPIYTHIR